MICKIADNILSPLGCTTAENYARVSEGQSRLRRYDAALLESAGYGHLANLVEPFTASLFDWRQMSCIEGYTRFESIAIESVSRALAQTTLDVSSERVLFVVATTKGNVELLDEPTQHFAKERVSLGVAARQIADYFGHRNQPLVVSNACISGLSAQITAVRALECGLYDAAIVVGADVQSRFIISGFQSFKALSAVDCRPFDIDRQGLNLGEAAATIVYQRVEPACAAGRWQAVSGAVRNDAHHISNPSPTGEGCYRALRAVMANAQADELAFINVHGTSTLYNDEMEAQAIARAGLLKVPVNSLKGYYGHTMGAAGVLEVVLSMQAADDGVVLATRGFEEPGVSVAVSVSAQNRPVCKQSFVKLLSGFGGCNAAMLFRKVAES